MSLYAKVKQAETLRALQKIHEIKVSKLEAV